MRALHRLSSLKVSKISEPGRYADGGGLYLQVSSFETKAWTFRYQIAGRPRLMGLGALHTVSLAEAREAARACRKLVRDGIDPIEQKRQKRLQAALEGASGTTFKEAAESYITLHAPSWRNPKHASQWPASLATYVYPTIGHLSVAAIDVDLVMKCIERIWLEKPETASRVRGRIETVLDWAKAKKLRSGENPAAWRGNLAKLLPKRTKVRRVKHHPAMKYAELPGFVAELREEEGVAAKALLFTILTCARTGEAINAKWNEIDTDRGVWNVPAERMKAEREHRVPLSDQVLKLLDDVPREKGNPFVFPGGKAKRPLSNMAMAAVMRRMHKAETAHGRKGWCDPRSGRPAVPHGLRSTFRDWAAEATNFPAEAAELALAHAVGDKVEAAYRRGDMFEKRRKLAAAWASFCLGGKHG
jgi:integrase